MGFFVLGHKNANPPALSADRPRAENLFGFNKKCRPQKQEASTGRRCYVRLQARELEVVFARKTLFCVIDATALRLARNLHHSAIHLITIEVS